MPIPQTDLVTEATEHNQEFTEKIFGEGWSWKVWIRLPGKHRSCVYAAIELCDLLPTSVTSV
jgi:hypothetical protein